MDILTEFPEHHTSKIFVDAPGGFCGYKRLSVVIYGEFLPGVARGFHFRLVYLRVVAARASPCFITLEYVSVRFVDDIPEGLP